MKKILIPILFLIATIFAMSDSPKDEPKADSNKITKEELHNIAVNYYTYMFEEEHEWKDIRIDSSKSVIMNITPIKDGDLTLAYIVNYNPDGHVFINAHKKLGTLVRQTGSGLWTLGVKEGFLSIKNKDYQHPVQSGSYERLSKALKEGKVLTTQQNQKSWDRFIVSPDKFHERHDFNERIPQPDWWLKKNSWKTTKTLKIHLVS